MKLTGLISVLFVCPTADTFSSHCVYYMYNHFHLTTVVSQPAIHQRHLSRLCCRYHRDHRPAGLGLGDRQEPVP